MKVFAELTKSNCFWTLKDQKASLRYTSDKLSFYQQKYGETVLEMVRLCQKWLS